MALYDWEQIRADYEAGASPSVLSRRFGASLGTIHKHLRAEGWVRKDAAAPRPRLAGTSAHDVACGALAGREPQSSVPTDTGAHTTAYPAGDTGAHTTGHATAYPAGHAGPGVPADPKAAILLEQRAAWEGFKADVRAALAANDAERLKCLKIASETLRNAQECERRAWGLADSRAIGEERPAPQAVAVHIDFSDMTPEQINDLGLALMGNR